MKLKFTGVADPPVTPLPIAGLIAADVRISPLELVADFAAPSLPAPDAAAAGCSNGAWFMGNINAGPC